MLKIVGGSNCLVSSLLQPLYKESWSPKQPLAFKGLAFISSVQIVRVAAALKWIKGSQVFFSLYHWLIKPLSKGSQTVQSPGNQAIP